MKNRFFILSVKEMFYFTMIVFLILLAIAFAIISTERIIETSSASKRLIPIYSVERNDKKVAITFDCAWGADDIESIVDTLEFNKIKATFFVVGSWVDKYPNAVKLIAKGGHDIGNHSNTHAHVNKLTYEENIEDMKKCNEKIEALYGKTVTLYRGPYGEYNNIVVKSAEDLKMKVIQWDVDTLDYMGKTTNEICERIKDKIRSGSIILMHNDTEYTAKGLQQIIDTIEEMGYEIVPVSELIYKEGYSIDATGRQKIK